MAAINRQAVQMMAMSELLLKKATELKSGQSGRMQAGPRKGLSEVQKKELLKRRMKSALMK